jgi:predicted O-methyltransferase YrrM
MDESKIYKTLRKIESVEPTWQCEITRKIDPDGRVHIYRTHLRSVSPLIGKLLSSLVLISKSKKILELGCSAGYSTLWISLAAPKHIYTTEILKEKIDFAKENFREAGVKNITILEGDITETLKKWNKGKLDFIFIDADKDKYLRYYDLVFPLLKKGGVIAADNVISHENILKPFLDKVKSDDRIIYSLVKMHIGLMIIVY